MTGRDSPSPGGGADVMVIGAGLAGSFTARALANAGHRVRVVDAQPVGRDGPASYAPRVALLQPKISERDDPVGRWLREGAALARDMVVSHWADDERVGWWACGALHVAHDARSERRLRRYVEQFGGGGGVRWVEASEAESAVGVRVAFPGMLLGSTGIVRPAGLCAALLGHPSITVDGGYTVTGLRPDGAGWRVGFAVGDDVLAGRVVVANALAALRLAPTAHLDLLPIRGQVSLVSESVMHHAFGLPAGGRIQRAVCFGGYLMPAVAGRYTLGTSFVPGDTDTGWRDSEAADAWERFRRILGRPDLQLPRDTRPTGWAGVRVTTPTRLPCAGPVERDGHAIPGLYASLGHGSHGIASAANSAQRIIDTFT